MLKTATDIRRAAMDLLARREHGVEELTRKLRQRGAEPESIAVELQRLVDEGLLSEQRYLESYVRSRANAGRGPARIREELLHRGLSRSAIEQALAEAETDWQRNLYDLWQRKFGEAPVDSKEYARQMRFLLYRGFSAEQAQRLLREISKQGDEY